MIVLKITEQYSQLDNGCYVLADCDVNRALKSTYVIMRKRFTSGGMAAYINTCKCTDGAAIRVDLLNLMECRLTDEEFLPFFYEEHDRQCIHASVAEAILGINLMVDDTNDETWRCILFRNRHTATE